MPLTSFLSSTLKPVEYEFTLPDGSKPYEFVDSDNEMSGIQQINVGLKLHGAVAAQPVQPTLFDLAHERHPTQTEPRHLGPVLPNYIRRMLYRKDSHDFL